MKKCLKPIYLNNGEFFIDKNFEPSETVEVLGPVSFLFSCPNSALKKKLRHETTFARNVSGCSDVFFNYGKSQ